MKKSVWFLAKFMVSLHWYTGMLNLIPKLWNILPPFHVFVTSLWYLPQKSSIENLEMCYQHLIICTRQAHHTPLEVMAERTHLPRLLLWYLLCSWKPPVVILSKSSSHCNWAAVYVSLKPSSFHPFLSHAELWMSCRRNCLKYTLLSGDSKVKISLTVQTVARFQ